MTDTGGFMHSNTTPEVLELSAELMRLGANKEEITEEIFLQQARRRDEAAWAASSTRCASSTTAATATRTSTTRCSRETGADGEDTEDTVNTLRGQDGVEVAALFKAIDGEIRVSLAFERPRSTCRPRPASLGGGGHFRASGLTTTASLDATRFVARRGGAWSHKVSSISLVRRAAT